MASDKDINGGLAPLAIWLCTGCGYIYDPAIGDPKGDIPPGVSVEYLPDSWHCPDCGAPKDMFTKKKISGYS